MRIDCKLMVWVFFPFKRFRKVMLVLVEWSVFQNVLEKEHGIVIEGT
uniref:Uncharacterized protein n=1 Tax=Arundo donax TaxID=35708 RepID=A0A0A8ZXG8_ARUDO